MIETLKNIGRAIIPTKIFKKLQPIWHGSLALLAHIAYGSPGKKIFVIGITGTAGKSTTVMLLAHILNSAGFKTGYITTVATSDGNKTVMNKHGLSMPSGIILAQSLHHFIKTGCKFAVVEATSEGLAQNRHLGIHFQMALFTNLSPAHLDAHGSFENYRSAKMRLFKKLFGKKIIGVNVDDPNYQYFANFPANQTFGISSRDDRTSQTEIPIVKATDIQVSENLKFKIEDTDFALNLKGSFNISNALLAIAASQYLGINLNESSTALKSFGTVPGRMEVIPNNKNITIIVDYAPEPAAMEQSLRACQLLEHNRLIHVFGSTGGHRDVAKRFEFGKISAQFADVIIITNDDVYDSDPEEIAKNVTEGINQASYKKSAESKIILVRRTAIQQAIKMANPGDLVLITGKGSEQFLVLPNNERIEWDDREVVKQELQKL